MWTCGIDMATQQATPAIASTAVKALGDRPSGLSLFNPPLNSAPADTAGGRCRSVKARKNMAAAQKMPVPT
jgi:hypothetical protein